MTWAGWTKRWSRGQALTTGLVVGGLALFVVLVYVVVVLGGGAVIGETSSPSLVLSVVAAAAVALAFDPVQSRLEVLASRVVHGGQPAPYDVLRRFSETVTGAYPAEELPSRMARVLAQGTGAEWAQVWLARGDERTVAATWPTDAAAARSPEDRGPGRRSVPVSHGGELLGVLVVQERRNVPLTSVEERLFEGLASQAGLVLREARLRAELERRLAQLSTRAEELRRSRQRVVDVQDAERRRLERDIHDGAQQHLVALAVNLRLADTLSRSAPERAGTLLADQEHAASDAIETLGRMARGIYPQLLEEGGVVEALRAAVANSPVPVELSAVDVGRYLPSIEAAAYFCCLEALQNAVKHAGATAIRVGVRGESESLVVVVEDDGRGFDISAGGGAGLTNMRDRVEGVDGTLVTQSTPSRGTRIHVALPTGIKGRALTGRG